jgi:acetyl-CoA synthetase
MNFARDLVDAADPARLALVALDRHGGRREWTFGEVAERAGALAGALAARDVRRGDVVLTLIGNRPEWVLTMVACFRIGAVVLPCTEQLRPRDLALRLAAAQPAVIVADERNRAALDAAAPDCPVLFVQDDALFAAPAAPGAAPAPAPAAPVELGPEDPCLVTFTSGTSGEPKAVVHAQRYLTGQRLQAEHWLDARPGDLVWCTAASGWSKSARNVFIAPWIRGAAALLHDARFDPQERLDLLADERPAILCMAPTEYRVIAKRAQPRAVDGLRGLVAAGEALNPEVLRAWHEATGVWIRDGYGQTETGQLTGMPLDEPARPGSMGRPLPGVRLWVDEGELCADPATVPTFFLGYLDAGSRAIRAPAAGVWRTGDRVAQDPDGFLRFEGRTDDVIISAGYRIGPFEVESALVEHPAVAEAAVVAAPDDERGSVVRAVVVLRAGHAPSDELARALQEHVKATTAPYKYPRVVEFAAELPKTASGKVRRAQLRAAGQAAPYRGQRCGPGR